MQCQVSPSLLSLKPLCPTRWTIHTAAINSVLVNYKVLHECRDQINEEGRDEYATKAGGIMRNRFTTV